VLPAGSGLVLGAVAGLIAGTLADREPAEDDSTTEDDRDTATEGETR
jgi:hypothetical protein